MDLTTAANWITARAKGRSRRTPKISATNGRRRWVQIPPFLRVVDLLKLLIFSLPRALVSRMSATPPSLPLALTNSTSNLISFHFLLLPLIYSFILRSLRTNHLICNYCGFFSPYMYFRKEATVVNLQVNLHALFFLFPN